MADNSSARLKAGIISISIVVIASILAGGYYFTHRQVSTAVAPKIIATAGPAIGMVMTFDEEFNTLDVSRAGPNTRWIAHPPYFNNFGDAIFSDPHTTPNGGPFYVSNGILTIRAQKSQSGQWTSGLLSSVDPKGKGFSQQYGYFEARMNFPSGTGTWPAFWMDSLPGVVPTREIDIVEQYGSQPTIMSSSWHLWAANHSQTHNTSSFTVADMTNSWHTYGLLWQPSGEATFFFDDAPVKSLTLPSEFNKPMYLMVNLALGGGYSTAQTPNPSDMQVDYIRAYQFAANSH